MKQEEKKMDYQSRYESWVNNQLFDEATKEELKAISDNQKEIEERFYKDLEFGTGGLRGIIGAGTNRMNIYTVGKATQGLANYICFKGKIVLKRVWQLPTIPEICLQSLQKLQG